jgi:N-methylhydantoinase A/oxoprolinase/acetone carboxylase beta subunit
MRIGIDVGGTNTDAVLMDGSTVLAEVKTATTDDVTGGILAALRTLVADSDVSPDRVQAVMIGTTHFTNAFVEGKRLIPTAAVRLGLPATRALPPMVDWPRRLVEAIGGKGYLCHGGHEFDGREIAPLDRDELLRVAEDIAASGLQSIAISAVFSPVNSDFETRAAEILAAELPDLPISLSHELGRMGMLERENATIMNACLRGLASHIVAAFNAALAEFGMDAPVYLSQNDGTLMTVDFAERYPVATFASGPTNSMRGAAFLSGEDDCAVVDIGGTTADVGVLTQGFPREASVFVDVGGVRTNFRMPDVLSLGIGGGSLVSPNGDETTVGPESVGYRLSSRALVFGGDTLTASDLAVADGRAAFGDASAVAGVDPSVVRAGLAWAERQIADAVDRMKTSAEPMPVVLVGGGSVLMRDTMEGASKVIRPDHFGVANAIGAAIAQVGGEVEKVFSLSSISRDDALDEAKEEAVSKAVAAGAVRSSVRVVDVEEVGLAYLPGNATRIKVKAIGDLELEKVSGAAHR